VARAGLQTPSWTVPGISLDTAKTTSTQAAFGKILDDLSKGDSALAERIVTTSPDVTGTTSLGAWVNRRKLFARATQADAFIEHRIPSTAKWEFTPDGQHIELGIAEMNLMLLLGAAGSVPLPLSQTAHSHWDRSTIPSSAAVSMHLNYACYQDARFHSGWHSLRRHAGTGRRRAPVGRHAPHRHEPGRPGGL
jgi:pyruvate dehydrogenase E1 component